MIETLSLKIQGNLGPKALFGIDFRCQVAVIYACKTSLARLKTVSNFPACSVIGSSSAMA